METSGETFVLTIITGESDKIGGKPLYEEIVRKSRELNLSGATVTRGIMSYGGNSRIHSSKIERLSEDLPVTITIIDTGINLSGLIPFLDEHLKGGIAFSTHCDIILNRHGVQAHE